ncbi:MAG: Metal-binding-domain/4Fe-4S-binding-domain containing ABC transporter, ATP-binding protein [archaeon GW2011_AR20]|nr:MAG: Metal-binding-domain/4Fe-4S-binding-domain containing ABC transporter, ATP-binding protein [archaeon GW2011_AR20]MBS3160450.1 hypothetical protein [Candidatus Woesearchaeota archaeon]
MDVAILYSGGKDSTYAIEYCQNKGWNIKYLISIKPNRVDCYLYHFATVELTKELSKILGYKHFYLNCNVADPEKEALIVKNLVEEQQKINKVDSLILGGVGLQETQLRSLQKALMPLNVEVFASHSGEDHEEIMLEMLEKGYEFMITQVASDGLIDWLGKNITKENIKIFFNDAKKYGFNVIGEGGYYDSLAFAGPIFGNKRLVIDDFKKVIENKYCGHIIINGFKIIQNNLIPHNHVAQPYKLLSEQ